MVLVRMSESRLLHIVREWIEYTKRIKTIDRRVALNYAREMEKELSPGDNVKSWDGFFAARLNRLQPVVRPRPEDES